MSVFATANVPDVPSYFATGSPAFGSRAACFPFTNDTVYAHFPGLSGDRCARHFVPAAADVFAASPSAAK